MEEEKVMQLINKALAYQSEINDTLIETVAELMYEVSILKLGLEE